jgi:hypothetical protein
MAFTKTDVGHGLFSRRLLLLLILQHHHQQRPWVAPPPCHCSHSSIIICIHYMSLKVPLFTKLIKIRTWTFLGWWPTSTNPQRTLLIEKQWYFIDIRWMQKYQMPFGMVKEIWNHVPNCWLFN